MAYILSFCESLATAILHIVSLCIGNVSLFVVSPISFIFYPPSRCTIVFAESLAARQYNGSVFCMSVFSMHGSSIQCLITFMAIVSERRYDKETALTRQSPNVYELLPPVNQ